MTGDEKFVITKNIRAPFSIPGHCKGCTNLRQEFPKWEFNHVCDQLNKSNVPFYLGLVELGRWISSLRNPSSSNIDDLFLALTVKMLGRGIHTRLGSADRMRSFGQLVLRLLTVSIYDSSIVDVEDRIQAKHVTRISKASFLLRVAEMNEMFLQTQLMINNSRAATLLMMLIRVHYMASPVVQLFEKYDRRYLRSSAFRAHEMVEKIPDSIASPMLLLCA
jgi:hypothetical protein